MSSLKDCQCCTFPSPSPFPKKGSNSLMKFADNEILDVHQIVFIFINDNDPYENFVLLVGNGYGYDLLMANPRNYFALTMASVAMRAHLPMADMLMPLASCTVLETMNRLLTPGTFMEGRWEPTNPGHWAIP